MCPEIFSSLTFLFLLLVPALVFGQERPETIIIPVSSLGEVNETRKQILQNTLEEQLKRYFKLVSQERFLKVQESAFEELDYRGLHRRTMHHADSGDASGGKCV